MHFIKFFKGFARKKSYSTEQNNFYGYYRVAKKEDERSGKMNVWSGNLRRKDAFLLLWIQTVGSITIFWR